MHCCSDNHNQNTQSYTICNSDNLYSYKALYALRETSFLNAFISYDRDALLFSSERIGMSGVASDNRLLMMSFAR